MDTVQLLAACCILCSLQSPIAGHVHFRHRQRRLRQPALRIAAIYLLSVRDPGISPDESYLRPRHPARLHLPSQSHLRVRYSKLFILLEALFLERSPCNIARTSNAEIIDETIAPSCI